MVKQVIQWFVEDKWEPHYVESGVIVELRPYNFGVYVRFVPYVKKQGYGTDQWSNTLTTQTATVECEDVVIYDNEVDNDSRLLMEAILNGNISGDYANNIVLRLIHKLVPDKWAKRFLPRMFEAAAKYGLNWDGTTKEVEQ
jgi:hypothetical protein